MYFFGAFLQFCDRQLSLALIKSYLRIQLSVIVSAARGVCAEKPCATFTKRLASEAIRDGCIRRQPLDYRHSRWIHNYLDKNRIITDVASGSQQMMCTERWAARSNVHIRTWFLKTRAVRVRSEGLGNIRDSILIQQLHCDLLAKRPTQ